VLLETNHQAIDKARFVKLLDSAPPMPSDVSLLACFLRTDHLQVTCIWESNSVKQIMEYVEPLTGGIAENSYFPIEALIPMRSEQNYDVLENPYHLHEIGKRLAKSNPEAAMAIFQFNALRNPHTWFVPAGLARGHAALGNFAQALEYMKAAFERAPVYRKEYVKRQIEKLKKQEDLV
jgi:hypothetical protein